MSDEMHGHGTTFSGATLGVVGEITSVSIDGVEVDDLEKTNMDSAEGWREFFAGLKNAGEIGIEANYKKADVATVLSSLGVTDTFTVTFPDGSTFACGGYIKNFGIAAPYDDKISVPKTVKLSGKPVFTPAA